MDPLSARCTATAKRSGERCQQWVIGGGVCRRHGGAAPQVRTRREARIVEGRARLAGQVVEQRDPGEALLGAAHDADATVQQIKRQFADGRLTAADLEALGSWLDRVGRLAKTVLDARIDERRLRIDERQARLLADGMMWVIGQLPAEHREQTRRLAAQMLRSLSAGVVPSGRPVIEQ